MRWAKAERCNSGKKGLLPKLKKETKKPEFEAGLAASALKNQKNDQMCKNKKKELNELIQLKRDRLKMRQKEINPE